MVTYHNLQYIFSLSSIGENEKNESYWWSKYHKNWTKIEFFEISFMSRECFFIASLVAKTKTIHFSNFEIAP